MRKNKKLLLASVAAMGALALGVGATSTFAWYTSQTTVGKSQAAQEQALTASKTNTTVDDILFTVSINSIDHSSLVLTDGDGKTGYMNGNTPVTNVTIPTGQYGEAAISVTVVLSVPSATGTDEQKAAKLQEAIGALAANDSPLVGATPSGNDAVRIRVSSGAADSSYDATAGEVATSALTLTQTAGVWATSYDFTFRASLKATEDALDPDTNFDDCDVNFSVGYDNSGTYTPYPAA